MKISPPVDGKIAFSGTIGWSNCKRAEMSLQRRFVPVSSIDNLTGFNIIKGFSAIRGTMQSAHPKTKEEKKSISFCRPAVSLLWMDERA